MTFTEIFEAIAEATGIEYSHFSVLGRIWDLADYYGVDRRGKLVTQVLRELPQLVNRSPESNLISDLLNLTMRYSKYLCLTGAYSQDTTTGKNLFDKETVTDNSYVSNDTGLVMDDNEQIRVASDYIKVDGLSNIYITDTDMSRWGAFYNFDKEFISGFIASGSINVPENARYLRFTIPKTNLDTFMINAGTQALPYEPYTGGAPSPSPDYPQEMQAVEISELKSSGRNMFDYQSIVDEATDAGFSTSAVLEEKEERNCLKVDAGEANFRKLRFLKGRFKENTQYKFSITGYYEGTGSGLIFGLQYTDGSNERKAFSQNNSFSNIEIHSASDKTVDAIFFSYTYNNTGWLDLDSSYIVELSEDTGEFPGRFVGDTVTLDEPLVLRALPDGVCDTYEDEVITRHVGVVKCDGSVDENWKIQQTSNPNVGSFYIDVSNNKSLGYTSMLCDKLIPNVSGLNNTSNVNVCSFNSTNGSTLIMDVANEIATTVDDWKTYLQSNPITVWFELEEPTTEALDIDLEWYGMENFWTDSELDPNMTWKGVSTGVD